MPFLNTTAIWKHLRSLRALTGKTGGGEGVSFSGFNCLSWRNFGSTLGLFLLFAQVGVKGCHGPTWSPAAAFHTVPHARAAVLDCTDNALLRARPSQQLLYLFRHTRLHRADEWVKIGGRHILISIISVWFGGVIGIIGLGRPSGLHMFPFSPRLLCWSTLISLMSKPECNASGCFQSASSLSWMFWLELGE